MQQLVKGDAAGETKVMVTVTQPQRKLAEKQSSIVSIVVMEHKAMRVRRRLKKRRGREREMGLELVCQRGRQCAATG